VSLTARHLEESGIPTVVIGCARDIVEEVGVARLLFSDVPLGNPCGPPGDVDTQRRVVAAGLDLLERAWAPRTTVLAPWRWPTDEWRREFMRVDDENRAALAAEGEARRERQRDRKGPS
jgi:hypothetical protein